MKRGEETCLSMLVQTTPVTWVVGGHLSLPAPPHPWVLWPRPGRWAPAPVAAIGTQSHIHPAVARSRVRDTANHQVHNRSLGIITLNFVRNPFLWFSATFGRNIVQWELIYGNLSTFFYRRISCSESCGLFSLSSFLTNQRRT